MVRVVVPGLVTSTGPIKTHPNVLDVGCLLVNDNKLAGTIPDSRPFSLQKLEVSDNLLEA